MGWGGGSGWESTGGFSGPKYITFTGDSGTPQIISLGDILDIEGGADTQTIASAGKITINTIGSGGMSPSGDYSITGSYTFDKGSGIQPFLVDDPYATGSTITNLSADKLDGLDASDFEPLALTTFKSDTGIATPYIGSSWVDIYDFGTLSKTIKVSAFIIINSGSPTNPVYRLVVGSSKIFPYDDSSPVDGTRQIMKYPVTIPAGNDCKIQVNCIVANGNAILSEIAFIEFG